METQSKTQMKKLLILFLTAFCISSCNRNNQVGVLVEVSGRVFFDSSHIEPVVGAEVVLLEYSSFFLSQRIYVEDNSILTDSLGNYSLSTISEESENYAVWLKPDLFTRASDSVTLLKEWEPNTVDLGYVSPIVLDIELIGDSICEEIPDKISGYLKVRGEQELKYFHLGYLIDEQIPLTWSRDTIVTLSIGSGTSLAIDFFPNVSSSVGNCYNGLTSRPRGEPYWYQPIDSSMTIRLKRE